MSGHNEHAADSYLTSSVAFFAAIQNKGWATTGLFNFFMLNINLGILVVLVYRSNFFITDYGFLGIFFKDGIAFSPAVFECNNIS